MLYNPRLLIAVDTSESMNAKIDANSCSYFATKMGALRCALSKLATSISDAELGLMQFAQSDPGHFNCAAATCDRTAASSLLDVGISPGAAAEIAPWVNNQVNASDPELCGVGGSPLGGLLTGAREYFMGASSPTASDTSSDCRPLSVILVTDGVECCAACQPGGCPNAAADTMAYLGSAIACQVDCASAPDCMNNSSETAPERAYELYNETYIPTPSGTMQKHVRTYPIGFGVAPGDERIENLAKAGHTDAPGEHFARYAADEAALSVALQQIILENQQTCL